MRILLIGGTLFIGKRLASRLLTAGHEITLLHRRVESPFGSDSEVRNLVADRNDAESIRSALGGRRFDAVYDIAYDMERGTTAQQVEATAKVIPGDLTRYIFISSVMAYGSGVNHVEDDPLAPDTDANDYVRNKAASERALFRMHRESQFPAVTMRPPYVYGPENPLYREAFFWDRLRVGRPIVVPGNGERLMQFVYVDDLVAACVNALTNPLAVGLAFNVANEQPTRQVDLVHALAEASGKKAEIVHVPRPVIERHRGNVSHDYRYFGEYYDIPPITEVVERVKRVLHVEPIPFAIGLQVTYKWYLEYPQQRCLDFSFEDALIREAGAA
jgi:nucleoside-diphosphate-sugar epimerase